LVEGGAGADGDWVSSRARNGKIVTTTDNDTSISKEGWGFHVKRSTVVIVLTTLHEGSSGGEDINTR